MLKTLVKMHYGSRVYGTSGASGDTDFRAVHVPESKDILLQRAKTAITEHSKLDPSAPNSPDDFDLTSYSLQHYLSLLLKGAPDCLSMLFIPEEWVLETTPEWERLKQSKEHWLSRGLDKMTGFCRGKMSEYGISGGNRVKAAALATEFFASMIEKHGSQKRLDEAREDINAFVHEASTEFIKLAETVDRGGSWRLEVCEKKAQAGSTLKDAHKTFNKLYDGYTQRAAQAESGIGIDWKELMHVVRTCHEVQELLINHQITYPRPEAPLLLSIRNGELPFSRVAELIDDGILQIEECHRRSTLPDSPDQEAAELFVVEIYKDHVTLS